MVKKAKAAGQFLGGIFNNPAFVILGLGLGALFIFRDRISEGFAGIAEGFGKVDIKFPDINLPQINFPEFPQIEFPEFPDFSNLFGGFQEQLDNISKQFKDFKFPELPPLFVDDPTPANLAETVPDPLDQNLSPGLAGGRDLRESLGLTPAQEFAADKAGISGTQQLIDFLGLEFAPSAMAEPQPNAAMQDFGTTVIQSLGTDQVFTGGGVGFQGGSVSPTPITTLTQVLDLFPQITASQAANFLSEFSGILPEQALQQGFEVVSLSSSPLDPPQMFNQSSLGTEGISPEELFKLLFPTLISNF